MPLSLHSFRLLAFRRLESRDICLGLLQLDYALSVADNDEICEELHTSSVSAIGIGNLGEESRIRAV